MSHTAPVTVYLASAVQDAAGLAVRPGAVAVRGGWVVASGDPADVRKRSGGDTVEVELPDRLLLPGMVNAHAHLDLTLMGPRPYGGDFVAWLGQMPRWRPGDAAGLSDAVAAGAGASLAAGVGVVGDTAYTMASVRARVHLPGVAYLEVFGLGAGEAAGMQRLEQTVHACREAGMLGHGRWLHLGLSPHMPCTAGPGIYQAAVTAARAEKWPLMTHLAETLEERDFVRDGSGVFGQLLRPLQWIDHGWRGWGVDHPIDHLEPYLRQARWLLAHCNYVEERHVALLARVGASVAYCPVASAYFGHPARGRPPHRYREMIEAGVNVCLGTDSIICQPAEEAQPLGILPQMRFLYRRDNTDPGLLLRMATVNGARALGLEERLATLQVGARAPLVAVPIDPRNRMDPLVQALRNDSPAQPVGPADPPERG